MRWGGREGNALAYSRSAFPRGGAHFLLKWRLLWRRYREAREHGYRSSPERRGGEGEREQATAEIGDR